MNKSSPLPPILISWNFKHHPAVSQNAEDLSEDLWQIIFIDVPGIKKLLAVDQSTALLAERGGGKTASRFRLITSIKRDHPESLIVNFTNFEHLHGRSSESLSLADHRIPLIEAIASAFADEFVVKETIFLGLQEKRRNWFWALLLKYASDLDKLHSNLSTSLSLDLQRFQSQPVIALWRENSKLETMLKTFLRYANLLGFTWIVILIDGLDGLWELTEGAGDQFCRDLLAALPILRLKRLRFKLFLPIGMKPVVESSSGYQTNTVKKVLIQWEEDLLIEILNLRIRWASDNQVEDLEQICAISLTNRIPVSRELARMALRHRRLGPPRALLHILETLIASVPGNKEEITLVEWEKFQLTMNPELRSNLFISYSHKDKLYVEQLAFDLSTSNLNIWLDKWEIQVGDSIIDKIEQGLSASDYLVIILSPHSVSSKWVKEELNAALFQQLNNQGIKVLPALIEDCELPLFLRNRSYADFRKDYQFGLNQLLRAVAPESIHARKVTPQISKQVETNGARALDFDSIKVDIFAKMLDRYFSTAELRTLSLQMEIDYENLEGTIKRTKAESLVQTAQRHGVLEKLYHISQETRPNASWRDIF